MDTINYKQVALNVLTLIDAHTSKKIIEHYIHYSLYPDDTKYNTKNYTFIWKALDIIDGK
jgi:hypothetical protein